nr:Biomphalaria glabrata receptor-type guanylate cyclase gcy-28-like [Biomphalaria glabrata]
MIKGLSEWKEVSKKIVTVLGSMTHQSERNFVTSKKQDFVDLHKELFNTLSKGKQEPYVNFVTEDEVTLLFKRVDVTKACGPDKISGKLIKLLVFSCVQWCSHVFNGVLMCSLVFSCVQWCSHALNQCGEGAELQQFYGN